MIYNKYENASKTLNKLLVTDRKYEQNAEQLTDRMIKIQGKADGINININIDFNATISL